ncbi:hypothetical protein BF17_01555 [Yersinia similis]|uniref:Uncharacterized protein n=1 Tax=Yersinia similis TaxID=367190 RepID=A0ABN4CHD3_9GAMM|nr:hypothetical protein BF17_01555 [Yersinia similis]
MNGEDRQRSKASAPGMARLEPTWMYLRRLYDLPVLSVAGTLSITSGANRPLKYDVTLSLKPNNAHHGGPVHPTRYDGHVP